FSDSLLYIKEVTVDNPMLQNFKNKQIYVPPSWIPMIYQGLQKAPFPINIDKVTVNNFGVIYEELAKNKIEPGRLVFTELNGVFTGFTNIVSHPEQYIRLDADGKLYGQGHFNAIWYLPVDSLNDRFLLQAHLPDMDLLLLNEIIRPLADAELKEGHLNDFRFVMDAGSAGGSIDMLFLYDGLKVNIFQIKDGVKKDKKFLNFLANAVVRDNNPNNPWKTRSKPRLASDTIIRDPYHSTFNYLWQLLRPALIESVGISKTQQKIAMRFGNFITKVKNLFGKGKKEVASDPPSPTPETH
ncbi:MAG: hypothetical protein LUG98_15360, partial [Tannerellaceae bacterium]|nr:hypothetical protein [Tannerellaceae bacterium]